MLDTTMINLFHMAENASKNSYSPYSNFPVGAAIIVDDDSIITGTNIENRSYGLTNCAERSAIFTAMSKGYRTIKAVAIVAPKSSYPVGPCGACRQVISEFALSEDIPVWFGNTESNIVKTTIGELYPFDSLHELGNTN